MSVVTPLKLLKDAVREFEKAELLYCLAGGHAASLYRRNERVTRDVDFALLTEPASAARVSAEKIIQSLGLAPVAGFIPLGKKEQRNRVVCMVTSAPDRTTGRGFVDILLPELPWVSEAVTRAQHNRLNLGFAKVPVITPEDLIIAKCYALQNEPDRFQDLDDVKEILLAVEDLDYDYLHSRLARLSVVIPEQLRGVTPRFK